MRQKQPLKAITGRRTFKRKRECCCLCKEEGRRLRLCLETQQKIKRTETSDPRKTYSEPARNRAYMEWEKEILEFLVKQHLIGPRLNGIRVARRVFDFAPEFFVIPRFHFACVWGSLLAQQRTKRNRKQNTNYALKFPFLSWKKFLYLFGKANETFFLLSFGSFVSKFPTASFHSIRERKMKLVVLRDDYDASEMKRK